MRFLPLLFGLGACGSPDDGPRRAQAESGNPAAWDSADTDGDSADSGGGLAWSGDLAPYDGCLAGDPAAKLLAQTVPEGPVGAGSTVAGELVLANCEGDSWVAATTEDAVQGVKLASTSSTVTDTWGRARVLLPGTVPPATAVRLRWTATAPLVNGPHPWQWQLVDEWVRWIGHPTPMASIEVVDGYGPFTVHARDEWEIRGHDIRNAASGCPEDNCPGYTIIIPTKSAEESPTGAQIEGARAAILRIRDAAAASGNTNFLYINGHRDVIPACSGGTSCPGEPIVALIGASALEP